MNRHVNRLVLIGAVATLALASCNKNKENGSDVPKNGFRATVEVRQEGSRTHLDGYDGVNEATVKWTAGDQILVRNNNNEVQPIALQTGANTTTGDFGPVEDAFLVPTYTAIYPASAGNSITGEGRATFTLPGTQPYTADGFGEGIMPMIAVSDDNVLPFKNVLGGICFPMTSVMLTNGTTVTSLVLTSSTSENLYGTFTVDYNDGNPTLDDGSNGGNSLTLDCGNGGVTLDATTATNFIFMVPAGTLASGFTLVAKNGENVVFTKTTAANPGITRSVIVRAMIPPLTVTTISPTFITKNSALGLGSVSATPAECGILYAKASQLTTPADELVIGGTNTNVTNLPATAVTNSTGIRFDASLTGLDEDVVYYVRAWAKSDAGTIYYGDP